MQNLTFSNPDNTREQTVIDLTSFMVHKHYCENDVEAIISLFDEDFHWLGAAEQACRLLTCNQVIAQMLGKTEEADVLLEQIRRGRSETRQKACSETRQKTRPEA